MASGKWLLAVMILVAALARPAAAAPELAADLLDPPVEYRADFYLKSDQGDYTGRVFHAPRKDRREVVAGAGPQVLILRRDVDKAWLLMPERRWYMGLTFQAVSGMVGGFEAMTLERRKLGTDTVAGRKATRYEVTGASPDGGRFTGDMWFSAEGILLKAVGTVRFQGRDMAFETGLKNLKVQKVEPALFQLPDDYRGLNLDKLPPDKVAQMLREMQRAR